MIDSHHHLWKYNAEDYPWIPKDSLLAKDHLLPELEGVSAAAGLSGSIVVQARQIDEESTFLLDLADKSSIIKAVVGWLPLAADELRPQLEKFASHAKARGLRHVLQDEPDEFFDREDFHRGLSQLPDFGLSYDLLIFQRQIPVALDLIDRQPNLPIILNHIAKPEARNGEVDPTWRHGMKELAKRDNLIGVKFSGLLTEFPAGEGDLETIRRYFQETLEIFGSGNILFGTDWPVCQLRTSYQDWVDIVTYLTEGLTETERDAIHSRNAEICYRLEK